MNVFDEHPFRVILDYGHNAAAMQSICQLTDRLEVAGRRICVLAAPGDRRDQDIQAIADTAAGHFDHYICKTDDHRRGRGPDEVPQMLRAQLLARGVAKTAVVCIPSEVDAIQAALHQGHEGDLIVIFGDNIERCWAQIVGHKVEAGNKARPELLRPAPSFVEPDPEAFRLDPAAELVRDGRGVRIARVEEESD